MTMNPFKAKSKKEAEAEAARAAASAAGSGQRRNNSGVTMFTRLSVHWAERMVAITSWNGVAKSREQWAAG